MEDPIFDPWSQAEEPAPSVTPPAPEWLPPPGPTPVAPSTPSLLGGAATAEHGGEVRQSGPAQFLRSAATPRLEAISRRLRVARHETSLQDLLDDAPHLLRFELRPWAGPLARHGSGASAMLEIGLASGSDELVTAWYWLDPLHEAPDEIATVPTAKLTASWIERVILDFVGKVLERT